MATRSIPPFTDADRARFEKFLRRDEATGCLLYMGARDPNGYGRFGYREDCVLLAHRVAWVLAGRAIIEERPWILHDCPCGDTPACCEPDHLWAGTQADNVRDMALKGRGRKSLSGLPLGVRHGRRGRYKAFYASGGYQRHLGVFDTVEEASAAALAERRRVLGR